MDTHDFVIIGAGPAGEAAAHKARELGATVAVIDRRWFGGSCPHIGCLPSKSLLADAARHHANPAALEWPRASAHRDYMINRATDARRAGRHQPRQGADGGRRRRLSRDRHDRGTGPGRRPPRRRDPRPRRDQHRRRRRVGLEAAADRGSRGGPDLDQRAGDAGPRAAAEPGRPRRRPDGLRAGPGLCPLRRADDDRPVRAAAGADRPPAQLRGRCAPRSRRTASTVRTGVRALRARAGAGHGRRPRHRARRRLDRRGPRRPARRRSRRSRSTTWVSSTTASTRPGGRRSRATGGCASPTGCGSSATRPGPSCTPTRPTTRARWPSGWRSARRSCPTTARSPGRPTPSPRRRRSA